MVNPNGVLLRISCMRPTLLSFFGLLFTGIFFTGCVLTPLNPYYEGPAERPAGIEAYYSAEASYRSFDEELLEASKRITVKRITLQTELGETEIDYFIADQKSEELILVLPVLGGRNLFANYFARYFAYQGFDAAVIHRDGSFKNPENVAYRQKRYDYGETSLKRKSTCGQPIE